MKVVVKKSTIQQQGFTLIELVIVIVILGILAATAAPKFIDLQDDAKDAVNDGIAAAMESAASLVYAKAVIASKESGTASLTTPVADIVNGYPKHTSIVSLLDLNSADFTTTVIAASNLVVISRAGTTGTIDASTACTISYTDAAAGERPSIAIVPC